MSNASPLTISMTGDGNDAFVFWIADCVGNEGKGDWFDFVKGTNVHEQSRADTCKLRYNAKSFSRLSVMNRRTGFPGHTIYDSCELLFFTASTLFYISCTRKLILIKDFYFKLIQYMKLV